MLELAKQYHKKKLFENTNLKNGVYFIRDLHDFDKVFVEQIMKDNINKMHKFLSSSDIFDQKTTFFTDQITNLTSKEQDLERSKSEFTEQSST